MKMRIQHEYDNTFTVATDIHGTTPSNNKQTNTKSYK